MLNVADMETSKLEPNDFAYYFHLWMYSILSTSSHRMFSSTCCSLDVELTSGNKVCRFSIFARQLRLCWEAATGLVDDSPITTGQTKTALRGYENHHRSKKFANCLLAAQVITAIFATLLCSIVANMSDSRSTVTALVKDQSLGANPWSLINASLYACAWQNTLKWFLLALIKHLEVFRLQFMVMFSWSWQTSYLLDYSRFKLTLYLFLEKANLIFHFN